jgi:hypothetical protein
MWREGFGAVRRRVGYAPGGMGWPRTWARISWVFVAGAVTSADRVALPLRHRFRRVRRRGLGRRARCAIDTRAADLIEIARRHRYGHKERITISTASPSASAFESVALSPSEQCRPDGPFRAGAIASASPIRTFGESKAGAHRGIRGRRPLLVARSLSTHPCAVACVRARRSFECDSRAG